MKNVTTRRSFFNKIVLSTVGFAILNTFPFNLFAKNKSTEKIKVNIHPSAVKRNRQGSKR